MTVCYIFHIFSVSASKWKRPFVQNISPSTYLDQPFSYKYFFSHYTGINSFHVKCQNATSYNVSTWFTINYQCIVTQRICFGFQHKSLQGPAIAWNWYLAASCPSNAFVASQNVVLLLIFGSNWKTWTNVENLPKVKLYAFSSNKFINNNCVTKYKILPKITLMCDL